MGKIVQVLTGYYGVTLPENVFGHAYQGGQQATLTDAEYTALSSAALRSITVVQSGVTDPVRPNLIVPAPDSLTKATQIAESFTTTQLGGLSSVYAPIASPAILTREPLPSTSPVASRAVQQIQSWLKWLKDNSVAGVVTETGWPANRTNGDTYHWSRVAENWLNAVAFEDVPVSAWTDAGTFAFITGATAAGGAYNTLTSGAAPLLRHATAAAPRGFQMGGVVGVSPPIGFNNGANTSGSNWWPDVASYAYLAKLGVKIVRVSFRWEVMQPALNGALSATALAKLQAQIAAASNAGISVIVDCHNYCSYITAGGTLHIGDGTLTQAHIVDLWTKLSTALKGLPGVYGYELMNEPSSLPVGTNTTTTTGTGTITPGTQIAVSATAAFPSGHNFGAIIGTTAVVLNVADGTHFNIVDAAALGGNISNGATISSPQLAWETISQALVTAIRGNTDTTLILVPGYDYQNATRWRWNHPVSWITDSGSNFRYAAHHYFSSDPAGDSIYSLTWAAEEAALTTSGPSSVGSQVGYPPSGGLVPGANPGHSGYAQTLSGLWTIRGPMGSAPSALTSGTMNLTYTRVRRSEPMSQTVFKVLSAASIQATLLRIGVYEVRSDGSHVLIASTANLAATVGTTGFTIFTQALQAALNVRSEMLIAFGALAVMPSGTAPVFAGISNASMLGGNFWPPLSMSLGSQTDLPAYFNSNGLVNSTSTVLAHGLIT